MKKGIFFHPNAWEDYCYWQKNNSKTVSRINALLKDIQRHPFEGIGKPEPLKHQYRNFWSRRIDSTNRLVYTIKDGKIIIVQCRFHYE